MRRIKCLICDVNLSTANISTPCGRMFDQKWRIFCKYLNLQSNWNDILQLYLQVNSIPFCQSCDFILQQFILLDQQMCQIQTKCNELTAIAISKIIKVCGNQDNQENNLIKKDSALKLSKRIYSLRQHVHQSYNPTVCLKNYQVQNQNGGALKTQESGEFKNIVQAENKPQDGQSGSHVTHESRKKKKHKLKRKKLMSDPTKLFRCRLCFKPFRRLRKLEIHMRSHDTFKCPLCEVGFHRPSALRHHFITTHALDINADILSPSPDPQHFWRSEGSPGTDIVISDESLIVNLEEDENSAIYVPPEELPCQTAHTLSVGQPVDLQGNWGSMPFNEKGYDFKCSTCPKIVATCAEIVEHVERFHAHSDMSNDESSFLERRIQQEIDHIQSESPDHPDLISGQENGEKGELGRTSYSKVEAYKNCPLCPTLQLENSTQLYEHFWQHQKQIRHFEFGAKKKKYCFLCQRQLSSTHSLCRHFKSHCSHRTFVCLICSKRFMEADKLRSHLNCVHLANPNELID